ncbi:hypothetical protein L9F63_004395, partial [Diploptera punctata]
PKKYFNSWFLLFDTLLINHMAAATILLSWTKLVFLTGRLPMISVQLEMLKKRKSEDIENRSRENEKLLQKTIQNKFETLRNEIDSNINELEENMQTQLETIEKTEKENKQMKHRICILN